MKLSAPVFHLKRRAKALSRKENIPLASALDRIAVSEGYSNWSLLAARVANDSTSGAIFSRLAPGDLLLMGARPGHGKTLKALELLVDAINAGKTGVFFTLEYNEGDVQRLLQRIVADPSAIMDRFSFDGSDAICADYIIDRMNTAPPGTVIVVDYLQLLDQRRDTPALSEQVSAIKKFATERGLIFVFIAQIDRSFELSGKKYPELADVRSPNPLDLTIFDKTCFLTHESIRFGVVDRNLSQR